jgi:hypothetical protein
MTTAEKYPIRNAIAAKLELLVFLPRCIRTRRPIWRFLFYLDLWRCGYSIPSLVQIARDI